MDLQNLVNNVKSMALNIGEKLTPVLKESKFRETGVLTPDEYVAAGNHLVHHCPTWKWAKASDPSRIRPYLPEDKQYLITRNVPCHKRCKQMEYDEKLEKIVNGSDMDTDSDWVDTHHYEKESSGNSKAVDLGNQNSGLENNDNEEEEILDLDDLVESGGLEEDADPNRFVAALNNSPSGDVERPRTYDLHICYDKYYQVPRVYLMGYDENRKPLSVEQTYEDFSSDHANKTITVESHPSLALDLPTVHPCKHAEMMKRLITQYAESGRNLEVTEYLLLFLKFVQAVIPTIEYDYTRAIKL